MTRAFRKDKELLRNLYSLYLHDLSKYTNNLDIEEDGHFHFSGFQSFWEEEGLSPYILKNEQGAVIGFLLLVERPLIKKDYDYSVNDLFILNKYRNNGYAGKVIEQLFKEKKGKHFVVQLINNKPAIQFWHSIYEKLGIQYEERVQSFGDDECVVQSFNV